MTPFPGFAPLFIVLLLVWCTLATSCDPSPAFPLPKLPKDSPILKKAFEEIQSKLSDIDTLPEFNTSSFSIEITSSTETLWTFYHTAIEKDDARPGAKQIAGDSVYRIASITKAFTTLAIIQQHIAGNLHLDDTVDKYVAEFREPQEGGIPWKDITLRTIASQLSGIPREFAQSDFINSPEDPTAWGLPSLPTDDLPHCDEYNDYKSSCTRKDLVDNLRKRAPLFAPKQKSTYSNLNFELLGIVLENVTGLPYTEYIEQHILEPFHMTSSSLQAPDDSVAVLPKGNSWYFNFNKGIQNPTGGIYSSSSDLSKFLRYILTHYNGLSSSFNWVHPQSYAANVNSFYGMPWEIFRTDKILEHTARPVTFVTKSGGHPGYITIIMAVPEYDLGITILTAGNPALLSRVREDVTRPLINAVENVAQSGLGLVYSGTYTAEEGSGLNTSITLAHTTSKGLYVESFVSNGTDLTQFGSPLITTRSRDDPYRLQAIPTLLYKDEKHKRGEIWRILTVSEEKATELWDDFCITDDDAIMYAGKPLTELVFWVDDDGQVKEAELTAFRVKLSKREEQSTQGEWEQTLGSRFEGEL